MADPIVILGGIGAFVAAVTPGIVALRNAKRQDKETSESISAKAFDQAEKFYDKTLKNYDEALTRAQAALQRADEQLVKYREELRESQYEKEFLKIQVNELEKQKIKHEAEIKDLKERIATLERERGAIPPDEGQ